MRSKLSSVGTRPVADVPRAPQAYQTRQLGNIEPFAAAPRRGAPFGDPSVELVRQSYSPQNGLFRSLTIIAVSNGKSLSR
jgi:hypothetical protein